MTGPNGGGLDLEDLGRLDDAAPAELAEHPHLAEGILQLEDEVLQAIEPTARLQAALRVYHLIAHGLRIGGHMA